MDHKSLGRLLRGLLLVCCLWSCQEAGESWMVCTAVWTEFDCSPSCPDIQHLRTFTTAERLPVARTQCCHVMSTLVSSPRVPDHNMPSSLPPDNSLCMPRRCGSEIRSYRVMQSVSHEKICFYSFPLPSVPLDAGHAAQTMLSLPCQLQQGLDLEAVHVAESLASIQHPSEDNPPQFRSDCPFSPRQSLFGFVLILPSTVSLSLPGLTLPTPSRA